MYFYHDKPPLIIDQSKSIGLYYDVIEYLNNNNKQYFFRAIYVPKRRINVMIDNGSIDGLILGVAPAWFKDKEETKFLWSNAILADQDEFVSLASAPFEYANLSLSKSRVVLGGVRGFYYHGIDADIAAGKITRVDTINEKALLGMLLNQRIDVAIISQSTFNFITHNENNSHAFHLSSTAHDTFQRKIMIPKQRAVLKKTINAIISQMHKDEQWLKTLKTYNIKP